MSLRKYTSVFLAAVFFLSSCGCDQQDESETTSPERTSEALAEPISDFTGIPDLENTTGISSLNNKECMYQPFCYDGERIYFANPRDGQFLYSYDGERLTRLAEMPVYGLNYCDNAVYFLSNGGTVDPQDRTTVGGYLYRYDLSENKTDKLSDFLMEALSVNAEGIFYQNPDENGLMTVYRFDQSAGLNAPLYHSFSIQSYNGYHLYNVSGEEKTDFFLSNDKDSFRLPIEGIPRYDCIVNGKYYYRPQGAHSLIRIDLSTGEQSQMSPADGRVHDYTVFHGTEYLLLDGELASYDNGKLEYLNCDGQYQYLFSGLHALYALKGGYGNGGMEYDLVELAIDGTDVHSKNITSPAA